MNKENLLREKPLMNVHLYDRDSDNTRRSYQIRMEPERQPG